MSIAIYICSKCGKEIIFERHKRTHDFEFIDRKVVCNECIKNDNINTT